jgi:large conductance mechanosensitive channel
MSQEEILTELKKIRELLTPPPAPPPPKGFVQEFKTFLAEYKVLGLTVSFILGIYLGALVKSLATDLLLPVIQLVVPSISSINALMMGPFGIGDFLGSFITFIIVAFVIFLIVKLANKYKLG